jgi:hypothetical protein
MVNDFTCRLKKAQCCVSELAVCYVEAKNHGEATPDMFNKLMLAESYIEALKRYNPCDVRCLPQGYIKYNGAYLSIGQKALYLSTPTHKVKVDPDRYNCLTQRDVERIFSQIQTLCGGCSCNC